MSDDDRPIWGAENIGKEINRTKKQVFHLVETGRLKVPKVGKHLVSTPRKLRRLMFGEAVE
jgi:hypothetical protein